MRLLPEHARDLFRTWLLFVIGAAVLLTFLRFNVYSQVLVAIIGAFLAHLTMPPGKRRWLILIYLGTLLVVWLSIQEERAKRQAERDSRKAQADQDTLILRGHRADEERETRTQKRFDDGEARDQEARKRLDALERASLVTDGTKLSDDLIAFLNRWEEQGQDTVIANLELPMPIEVMAIQYHDRFARRVPNMIARFARFGLIDTQLTKLANGTQTHDTIREMASRLEALTAKVQGL